MGVCESIFLFFCSDLGGWFDMPVSKEPMLQSLFLLLGQEGVGGGGGLRTTQAHIHATWLSLHLCFSILHVFPLSSCKKKQKTKNMTPSPLSPVLPLHIYPLLPQQHDTDGKSSCSSWKYVKYVPRQQRVTKKIRTFLTEPSHRVLLEVIAPQVFLSTIQLNTLCGQSKLQEIISCCVRSTIIFYKLVKSLC